MGLTCFRILSSHILSHGESLLRAAQICVGDATDVLSVELGSIGN